MANTTGLPALFATGNHAGLPAASAVGSGGLYSCTTHSLVYQTDGSSWTTWATLGTSGAFVDPMTTRGDVIVRNSLNATARLARGSADTYLGSDGTDVAYSAVTDAKLSTSDVTTNNATTAKHGFLKKLSNVATEYMDGTGAWSVPAGGGGGGSLPQPDAVPGSPSAFDDEFTVLSGWTNLGSPTVAAINRASILRLKKTNVGLQIHGIYKTAPSIPYAVIIKISDYSSIRRGNYTEYGLAVGDSTPTAWCSFSFSTFGFSVQRDTWTNNTSRASAANGTTGDAQQFPAYLMVVVNSATSIDCYWSKGGLDSWVQAFAAVNPGFTPSKIGIVVSANGVDADMSVDYIRFYAGTAGQTFTPETRTWA